MAQLKSLIVNGVSRFNNTTYSNLAYNDTTYSTNGFVKIGSDNTNILLAGGGVKPLSELATPHNHPYLPLVGGTMLGAIHVSATSNPSNAFDKNHGLNFGSVGHIGYATTGLGVYSSGELWLRPGQTGTSVNTNIGLALTSTEIKFNTQKVWWEGDQGTGSGLDADLLDGHHANYFAQASSLNNYLPLAGGTMTGEINASIGETLLDNHKGINFGDSTIGAHLGYIDRGDFGIYASGKYIFIVPGVDVNTGRQPNNLGLELTRTSILFNGQKVWYAGDQGTGSGLDADLLDGHHGNWYAPIASPNFTGTPTATTASAGTNTTQIATTAFVTTAVSNAVTLRPQYTIEKQTTAEDGYFASYKLKKTTNGTSEYVGDIINIPKDYLVKSGEIKTVAGANVPYSGAAVGDKYLDFVVNTHDTTNGSGQDTHIYIPVKDLVDIYTGGAAIEVNSNNKISAYLNSSNSHGLEITASGIGLNLASSSSDGAMSSSTYNKLWNEDFHNYLKLAGGVMTGAFTASTGSTLTDTTQGINFGTTAYGGHLGYVSTGSVGLYAKENLYLVPGTNLAGSGNNSNGLVLTTSSIKFYDVDVLTANSYGHSNDGHGINADLLDGQHAADLLTDVTLYSGGNSTKLDVTVGGTTLTSSIVVPYASIAGVANEVDWDDIVNTPETFPASPHDHDDRYLKLTGGTISGSLIINTDLTVNRNTTLGDANTDWVTINATTTSYAKTTTYNDIELKTTGTGASPKLIFNRTGTNAVDWMTYVNNAGYLYFAKATNASTWTTAAWIDDSTLKIHGNLVGNVEGNATSADVLKTPRTITVNGAVEGSAEFDGSANIEIRTEVNHTHDYAGSNSAGGAANQVVVNSGTDTNQTYNMVFHNANTLYSTTEITCNPSTDELGAKKLRASGNDIYVGSAANAQCHMQYDSTMKCIKFMFD